MGPKYIPPDPQGLNYTLSSRHCGLDRAWTKPRILAGAMWMDWLGDAPIPWKTKKNTGNNYRVNLLFHTQWWIFHENYHQDEAEKACNSIMRTSTVQLCSVIRFLLGVSQWISGTGRCLDRNYSLVRSNEIPQLEMRTLRLSWTFIRSLRTVTKEFVTIIKFIRHCCDMSVARWVTKW